MSIRCRDHRGEARYIYITLSIPSGFLVPNNTDPVYLKLTFVWTKPVTIRCVPRLKSRFYCYNLSFVYSLLELVKYDDLLP